MTVRIKLQILWQMIFLWILIVLGGGIAVSLAQEEIWVTAEGTAPLTRGDKDKARKQAIEAAKRNAVSQALASGISVETLLVNLRLAGSITGTIPYGKVSSTKILEEGPVPRKDGVTGKQNRLYRVRIKAGVIRESSGQAPSFSLDADINQSEFKNGDELVIKIRSTKDCYFAIFNILEDQKIIRLLPNDVTKKNFLSTNQTFAFPAPKDRKDGLKLLVHLPRNKESTIESIYILAMTRPFEMKSIKVQEGIFGVYNGQTVFMKDLIREIVGIPVSSRAEALLQYKIRKTR